MKKRKISLKKILMERKNKILRNRKCKKRSLAIPAGTPRGARAGRVGISSAQRCPVSS
jgi:hypothetical protein